MNSRKVVQMSSSEVEKVIKDLSLIVVSMDQIGSHYDDSERQAMEMYQYFSKIKAFELLARARALLSKAYQSQSTKAEMFRLEESADEMPYWKPTER
jgi:hypothetical protein